MKQVAIEKLCLQDFRIHKTFTCDIVSDDIILIGDNGSGKTSILEAISLLSPGKGMLSANPINLNYNKCEKSIITATITDSVIITVENKIAKTNNKTIKINDKAITKQTELANWCDIIWFTADTQYTFLLSSANRRKFVDRMVFGFFHSHASALSNYDNLIKERMKILLLDGNNQKWLDAIEKQIAKLGAEISYHRASIIQMFNEETIENKLLHVSLSTDGVLENFGLNGYYVEQITETFSELLKNNRIKDRDSGRTNIGTHRTDFDIVLGADSLQMVSSGKQKMFLLSIFELFARLLAKKNQRTPIILFDEISSFVDQNNFDKILSSFTQNHSQIWMASPRKYDLFKNYNVHFIELNN